VLKDEQTSAFRDELRLIEEEAVEPSRMFQWGASEPADELGEHDAASFRQRIQLAILFEDAREQRRA